MSKKQKLVSVIVPIYNREDLMKKCVDSILDQTYENIEVILVDDASTDNSYKVMKEYKKQDSRVKIFTYKKNGGAGHARNIGIDKSTGEYIIFVDSDDYIDDDYVETLVNNIGNADMICCGHKDVYVDDNIVKEEKLCNNSFAPLQYGVVWSRMYTNSSIRTNNIKFSHLKNGEDTRLIFEYILQTRDVVNINNYCGYSRIIHNKDRLSQDGIVNSDRFVNVLLNINDVLNKSTKENKLKEELYYFIIRELTNCIWVISRKENWNKLLDEYNTMFNFVMESFDKNSIKIHFIKYYDSLPFFVLINIYVLSYKLHLIRLYLKLMNLRYKEN